MPSSQLFRRALALSILGLGLLVTGLTQHAQKPAPDPSPVPSGGSYHGPGDTAPPPCGGPLCPQPPAPPSCSAPCSGDFLANPCTLICDKTQLPLPGVYYIDWYDDQGYPIAPPCMIGPQQVARVYEITIRDLLDACAENGHHDGDTIAEICMYNTCPGGIDGVFVYETIPFQYFPNGLPTSSGTTLPICGLGYDLTLWRPDGSCESLSAWHDGYLQNDTLYSAHCDTSIHQIKLQFDCACLSSLLYTYGWLGLYSVGAGTYLNLDSVAFVVLVKCCQSGTSSC